MQNLQFSTIKTIVAGLDDSKREQLLEELLKDSKIVAVNIAIPNNLSQFEKWQLTQLKHIKFVTLHHLAKSTELYDLILAKTNFYHKTLHDPYFFNFSVSSSGGNDYMQFTILQRRQFTYPLLIQTIILSLAYDKVTYEIDLFRLLYNIHDPEYVNFILYILGYVSESATFKTYFPMYESPGDLSEDDFWVLRPKFEDLRWT
jgi:hypothetical protein